MSISLKYWGLWLAEGRREGGGERGRKEEGKEGGRGGREGGERGREGGGRGRKEEGKEVQWKMRKRGGNRTNVRDG